MAGSFGLNRHGMQAARPALQRVKAGQPFLKVVGAPPAEPGASCHTLFTVILWFWANVCQNACKHVISDNQL